MYNVLPILYNNYYKNIKIIIKNSNNSKFQSFDWLGYEISAIIKAAGYGKFGRAHKAKS